MEKVLTSKPSVPNNVLPDKGGQVVLAQLGIPTEVRIHKVVLRRPDFIKARDAWQMCKISQVKYNASEMEPGNLLFTKLGERPDIRITRNIGVAYLNREDIWQEDSIILAKIMASYQLRSKSVPTPEQLLQKGEGGNVFDIKPGQLVRVGDIGNSMLAGLAGDLKEMNMFIIMQEPETDSPQITETILNPQPVISYDTASQNLPGFDNFDPNSPDLKRYN